jgi:glycosyltransferase involved in cell wall biosynthesis
MPNPKVDILISCYNKGKYIAECIESALSQTYKPFSIIIVDDGSTDNSAEIIKKYPVKYIHQNNQGVSVARNKAIDSSCGDYFILMDGDDKLHETYIERTLKEMKGDIQIVWTDFQGIGEWDWVHNYSGNINDLKNAQCIPSVMALCNRQACCDIYGNFDPTEHYEDYGWWIRMAFVYRGGLNFKHIPEPLCYYRRTKGSRIDLLDEKREFGFQQLRERYGKYGVYPK